MSALVMKRIAARVVTLRAKRGMSQAVLAAEAGINRVTLARLELGEVLNPRLETLERLAAALRTTLRVDMVERPIRRRR